MGKQRKMNLQSLSSDRVESDLERKTRIKYNGSQN